jgi:hypothetical protein
MHKPDIFDQSVYGQVVETNQEYKHFSTLLKMSFSDATEVISDSSVDLLHIDGYHSYESVSEDFFSWLPKMAANGLILLHDIHVRRDTFGVYKLWAEIKEKYQTMEFVGSHGLGVVFLGEIPRGLFTELFEISNSGNLAQIQGTFGSISDSVMQSLLLQESASLIERLEHERDGAILERDGAILERELIIQSKIWKASKFLRVIKIRFNQLLNR